MPDNFKSDESAFNMAFAYLLETHKSLLLCQADARSGNIDGWIMDLRSAYRCLSIKTDPEKEEDWELTGFKRVVGEDGNVTYENHGRVITPENIKSISYEDANFRNLYSIVNNPQLKSSSIMQIKFLLDSLEIKIRRKMQEKGMLLPSKDDPRFAVLKR